MCEIEDRPRVVLKIPLPFKEYDEAMEIENGIYLKRAELRCLLQYCKDGGKATPKEIIMWCPGVGQVLHHAHRHKVRYADLPVRNLLLDLT
jgi:hypothetical protein